VILSLLALLELLEADLAVLSKEFLPWNWELLSFKKLFEGVELNPTKWMKLSLVLAGRLGLGQILDVWPL
jgi:hypothetical protein